MSLLDWLLRSPFYPHWLEELKKERGNQLALRGLRGTVLEVGAGDGARKKRLLAAHPELERYVATDGARWDEEFEKLDRMSPVKRKILGFLPDSPSTRCAAPRTCPSMTRPSTTT